jgi:hypothetical protein
VRLSRSFGCARLESKHQSGLVEAGLKQAQSTEFTEKLDAFLAGERLRGESETVGIDQNMPDFAVRPPAPASCARTTVLWSSAPDDAARVIMPWHASPHVEPQHVFAAS